MLSDRERHALREVEQWIAAEDPRLANRLRRWPPPDQRARVRDALITLAVVLAVLCAALGAVIGALTVTVLATTLLVQRYRSRHSAGGDD